MNNLAIYVFYDKCGEVRGYVPYCLQGLFAVAKRVLVVVNGQISSAGRKKIEDTGADLLIRQNIGFDWAAWKAGIEHVGYDEIANLDNLILTNCTYYGPIYPFAEMFAKMDEQPCDFWGINRHPETEEYFIPGNSESKVLEHLQSYWLVFRKSMLSSSEFRSYWESQKLHKSYEEAVGLGETKLTRHFEACGFRSAAYMDFTKYVALLGAHNPTILPDEQLKDRCPVIKRKMFLYSGLERHWIANLAGENKPYRTFEYLKQHHLYNTDLIWEDILATAPLSYINDNLHLNYILPTQHLLDDVSKVEASPPKVALIVYIYFLDMVAYCASYASAMPEYTDIVVITTSQEVEAEARSAFAASCKASVLFRQQINRGRDNAALLVTCRDIIESYDYICFAHAKKSLQNDLKITSDDFREHCFQNILFNENYVRNIIATFKLNKRLGLLIPFLPLSGVYHTIAAAFPWTNNQELTERFLAKEYGITDRLDTNLYAPFGGMFWFKGVALKTMLSKKWTVEDFPEEPMPATDGLLPHVIERIYPMLAQYDGFYTAFSIPSALASANLNILYSKYRDLIQASSSLGSTVTPIEIMQWFHNTNAATGCSLMPVTHNEFRFLKFSRRLRQRFPRLKNFIKHHVLRG